MEHCFETNFLTWPTCVTCTVNLKLQFLMKDCHFEYTLNVSDISISPAC